MNDQLSLSHEEIDALAEAIAADSAQLDAGTQRLLARIRAFDEAGGWHMQGALSCAHWLSWRVGMALGAARERVRVARALGGLPRIEAALGRGEVSGAQLEKLSASTAR